MDGKRAAKPTIQDVSREAGVSAATVSRVFNRKNIVSKEVEERVWMAKEKLGYDLPQKAVEKTFLIAVIVPRLSNPFYNDILDGIQDTASRNKYRVIVVQAKSEYLYNVNPFSFLAEEDVDGVITLEHADNLKGILKNVNPNVAVVQCCEYDEDLPYPYVAVDDYNAARNAVNYLCSIGRKKIALLNSTTKTLYGKKRERGFRDAIEGFGLTVDEDMIFYLNNVDFTVAYSAVSKLLESDKRPDAIFAVSDVYAIAATRAANKLGLDVPGDLAIVGFDNIEMAVMNVPPLTTVCQPKYELGAAACSTLMDVIERREPATKELLLESELIVRSST